MVNFSKYNKETLSDYQLIIFGSDEPKQKLDIDMSVRFLGRIQDEQKMSVLYNANVLVMPSIADNLPQVAVESLACGTPVVTFNIGGFLILSIIRKMVIWLNLVILLIFIMVFSGF